jgi:Tol biopolymer transport system component
MLSAVLRDDPPPLRTVVPALSRGLERVTARCLQKDLRQRYQSAADLKIALEDARDDLAAAAGTGASAPAPRAVATASVTARRVLPRVGYLTAGAVIGAAALVASGVFRSVVPVTPYYRPFVTEAAAARWPAWSPDGRVLSYVAEVDGRLQVFLRSLEAAQPIQLTREPWPVAARPFWSPDGSRLYFMRNRELVSVGIAGGEARVVIRDAPVIDSAGAISPDGRTIVFARGSDGFQALWTADTTTGEARPLDREGLPSPIRRVNDVAFSPDGATLGVMLATAAQSGAPGVWLFPWPEGTPHHALADAPYYSGAEQTFSWMPDSRRIVFNASPVHDSASRLFMADTVTGAFHQVTAGASGEHAPFVSPDGARIAFVSMRTGLDLIEFPVDGGPRSRHSRARGRSPIRTCRRRACWCTSPTPTADLACACASAAGRGRVT